MPESKQRKRKNKSRPGPRPQTVAAKKKAKIPSPTWYVVLMFGLMTLGVALVLFRYIFQTPSNLYLYLGLVAIAAGFFMTTNYR